MATVAQLFIGYAHKSCNPDQVKEAFENALNEDGIVSRVDFRTKKNDRGEEFFVFFIHFDHENRQLQHMMGEIAKHGFVTLVYARDWDRRRNAYVERYWKVLAYKQKEVSTPAAFVPRLMSLTEATAAGITAPKKKILETKPAEIAEVEKTAEVAKPAEVAKAMPLPLTTDELYTPNLDWDSHGTEPAELPPVPPRPPVLRRSPSTAKEYGMHPTPKRRRSITDDAENAFAALTLDEEVDTDEERFPAPEDTGVLIDGKLERWAPRDA